MNDPSCRRSSSLVLPAVATGVRKEFHIKGTNLAGVEASLVVVAESEEDARRMAEGIGLERINVMPVEKPSQPGDPPESKA